MFSKITTKGRNQSPVYTWLTNRNLNGWNEKKPTWNFCKYLVDENGIPYVDFYTGNKVNI